MVASLLVFLSAYLSIVFKKSKTIALLVFGLMWIFFGWNYWNGDYDMYETMYINLFDLIDIFKYEGGYDVLMLISNFYGYDFQGFMIISSAFILISLFRFLIIYSKMPALVAFFFMIALFPLQYVLLRNFIAFAIVIHGFIPLFNNSKYKYIKCIIAISLACTIHISSFFYLLFLPAFFKKKLTANSIYITVAVSLVIFILSQSFIASIIDLSPKDRNSAYNTGLSQFIIYSFIQIVNLIFINHFLKTNQTSNLDANQKLNKYIININIFMLFLIVVYFKFGIFIRILINFSFINMIFVTNQFTLKEYNSIQNKLLILLYLVFNFLMFIYPVAEFSLTPMFDKNLLLD